MCGIVGYVGNRNSQQILLEGLKKLEYRGYDSSGIAVCTTTGLRVEKAEGHISALEAKLAERPLIGRVGIGHTRWATHGKPCERNSHPHTDCSMKISVVHNGIIENYLSLKEQLVSKGHRFVSDTDSEVIAHLISEFYRGDIVQAVRQAVSRLKGAYALAVLTEYEPDKLIAVRHSSPLIIGLGEKENFIGSDIPAILEHTRRVLILEDGEMAVLTDSNVELRTLEGNLIVKEDLYIDWDISTAEKAGYPHFMLKEIYEQPEVIRKAMSGRVEKSEGKRRVALKDFTMTEEELRRIQNIHLVACGTSYHAALVGKYVIELLARIPVETDIASEYRYRSPIVTKDTLVIAITQSGETADTLAAMREAKRCGARVLAVTNVVGSTAAREADEVLYTWAGPEISVASTKAYTTQLIVLYLFSIYLAQVLKTLTAEQTDTMISALEHLPEKARHILDQTGEIERLAGRIAEYDHLFYIGRGLDYAVALEGSLKMKEISYIRSEAYAAGELKHGTLALVEEGTPVIALASQTALFEKMLSNIKEMKARGAYVYGLTAGAEEMAGSDVFNELLKIPDTFELFLPVLEVIPLQLLAYYASVFRGNDVDKPRNLAKSVTVE